MIDFGLVDAVDAESIGEPGQRIFRVRVVKQGQYAAIWLEKQELAQLGRSISQLLAEQSDERGQPVDAVNAIDIFPSNPDVDIQALRISIDLNVTGKLTPKPKAFPIASLAANLLAKKLILILLLLALMMRQR